MKKNFFVGVLLLALLLPGSRLNAQEKKTYDLGLIGFYNLENLFDTIDDPEKRDEDFLPDGSYAWSGVKYQSKLHNLAECIVKIGTDEIKGAKLYCPDILGVSEVENIQCLRDLCAQPELAAHNFEPILVEGPDRRGVDVGLIYKKDKFKVTGVRSVPLTTIGYPTRDQLVVSGIYMGDEIHIIVNHWPSRLGGEAKSSPNREAAARLTRSIVDSLLAIDPEAKVIVMGDLNDDTFNKSVVNELNAPKTDDYTKLKPGQMFNASFGAQKIGNGTLQYKGKWNLFDQIIITQGLCGKDRSTMKFYGYRIFRDPMLLQKSGPYAGSPLRTTAGGVWLNGYSDHLPVFIVVIKEKK